jgi:glycosyltransferase involved in cell wall biosynthesis
VNPLIAFIAGHYEPARCGIADYTKALRDALHLQGASSVVLTSKRSGVAQNDPSVLGVVEKWNLIGIFSLAAEIKRLDAKIVHVQYSRFRSSRFDYCLAILSLPLILRYAHCQSCVVVTVHEDYPGNDAKWHAPWFPRHLKKRARSSLSSNARLIDLDSGLLLTRSDAVIATTEDNLASILYRMPWKAPVAVHIPIGSNIPVINTQRREARQITRSVHGWPPDTVIIASFGFLNPNRNLPHLLDAFKNVIAREPGARLLLIGGIHNMREKKEDSEVGYRLLIEQVEQLGLRNLVCLTGYADQENVSTWLLGSDVGVVPMREGTSLKNGSLLAMLAHGLPTIISRPQVANSRLGSCGGVLSVAPNDIGSLSSEILALARSPHLRRDMRNACIAFSRQFDWNSIARSHIVIYEGLVEASNPRSE